MPPKAWIDPTLLVIVLLAIMLEAVLGLWNGSLIGHIFAIVGIVSLVAIFGMDLVHRRAQRH